MRRGLYSTIVALGALSMMATASATLAQDSSPQAGKGKKYYFGECTGQPSPVPPPAQIPGYTAPKRWQYTSDPEPAKMACQQGDQEACVAVARRAQVGCQMMSNQEDCALAKTMATKGYR